MQPALVRCTVTAALVAVPAAAQLEWAKSPASPVLVHAATFPEGLAIGQPAVLQSGGDLRLWYTGAGLDARGRILGARSSDGGVTWRRHGGGPVLSTTSPPYDPTAARGRPIWRGTRPAAVS